MFYVSAFELTLTCIVIGLIFILPMIWKRALAQMDKRVKDLEKKIEDKK